MRYERAHANRRLLVLLNFGDSAVEVRIEAGTILAATDLSRTGQHINSQFQLRGAEGLLLQLDASRANPAHGAAAI